MKLVFVVKDAKHDKSAGLDISKEAKSNKVSEDNIINDIVHEFWELAQAWGLTCYLDDEIVKREIELNKESEV